MSEGKTRLVALVGTVALHVLVVWWLASSPEAQARILRAMDMDVVDLTPEPEPEPAPEQLAEPEPAPEPEPEPERVRPPRRARPDRPTNERSQDDDRPPSEDDSEPSEPGEPDQPPGPRVIDFGEQNFALSGVSTGWGMQSSSGGSRYGVYRPGARGGGGGGPSAGGGGLDAGPPDFSPVPESQLSRNASLIGRLERRYPEEARRRLIEGSVRLMVEVRANGRVRGVRVLSDPGGGLAEAAVQEIRRARFRPALDRHGQAADTRIVYTVRYILDD